MKKITEQEQTNLRQQALDELNRLETIFQEEETRELLDKYKNKFNLCESAYKVVLHEHQIRTKGKIQEQFNLDMRQVPHAMQFAGYTIDKNLLNRLFGAENTKGKRSAKKLRDTVTHGVEQAAVDEIQMRQEQLFKDMNGFLEVIRKV